MATLHEHIEQAKRNLDFLQRINEHCNPHWDWQVTTCFYVGVHLINGHLAKVADLHFENHSDTQGAINPSNPLNIRAVSEDCFVAYRALFNLSIRSRYLNIHREDRTGTHDSHIPHYTYDKHFRKAVKHLDTVIKYMSEKYGIDVPICPIDCIELKGKDKDYKHFRYEKKGVVV